MLSETLMAHKPYYPLHKVLTFLLFRSDSPQVYTLAMQVKGVGRQRHSCFLRRCLRCRHHQTGHGACRETMGCKSSRTKKSGGYNKDWVGTSMPEHGGLFTILVQS